MTRRPSSARTRSLAHAAPRLLPTSRLRGRARRGVTLVEMLVATAMCILGMWMLTWMFQQATASFSLANAQATLTSQERMVTTIMTRDLEANRFPEDDERATASGRRYQRLSDYDSRRPIGGYFLAGSFCPDNVGTYREGDPVYNYADSYGFESTRAGNHFIQFTAIRPDEPGNRVVAEVPAQTGRTIAGTAVEVSYFLVDTKQTTTTGAKLYDLMRVQRLVALNTHDKADYERDVVIPAYTAGDVVHEVMVTSPPDPTTTPAPTPARMHTLAQLSAFQGFGNPGVPGASPRFNPFPAPVVPPAPKPFGGARDTSSRRYGEDRLLSNVLSMEIKYTGPLNRGLRDDLASAAWPLPPAPNGSSMNQHSPSVWPRPFDPYVNPTTGGTYPGNKDFPYDFLPYDGQYDTATTTGPVVPVSGGGQKATREYIQITGVQIKIRALFGTTARQTTIIVAL